jgi:hypothetical protein
MWTNSDTGALETFQLDAVTSIDHNDSVAIADHPVEQGADISDHARDEPDLLTVEGMITNTPHPGNYTDADKANYSDQPLALSFDTMAASGTQTLDLDVGNPPIQPTLDSLLGAGLGALGKAIFGGPTAEMNNPAKRGRGSFSVKVKQPNAPRNRPRDAYEKLLGAKLGHELVTVSTPMRDYFDMLIAHVEQPIVVEDGTSARFTIDLRRIRIAGSDTVVAPEPAEARGSLPKSLGSQATKEDPNADDKGESILHKGFGGDS